MRAPAYRPEICEQATKLCKLGATEKEIAHFFGVATISNWKTAHPEFNEALKEGKEYADANVAESLYQRAIGYSHPDVHITSHKGHITITEIVKHYPPDTVACIYWLKNRRRDLWRDAQESASKDDKDQPPAKADDLEIARRMAYLLSVATIDKAAGKDAKVIQAIGDAIDKPKVTES